jgi:hypothetical protein
VRVYNRVHRRNVSDVQSRVSRLAVDALVTRDHELVDSAKISRIVTDRIEKINVIGLTNPRSALSYGKIVLILLLIYKQCHVYLGVFKINPEGARSMPLQHQASRPSNHVLHIPLTRSSFRIIRSQPVVISLVPRASPAWYIFALHGCGRDPNSHCHERFSRPLHVVHANKSAIPICDPQSRSAGVCSVCGSRRRSTRLATAHTPAARPPGWAAWVARWKTALSTGLLGEHRQIRLVRI